MSYDIIRNDIEDLQKMPWNYCILDEGHIIKNGKTKITKAIKSIRADHRLILSGTPIQVSKAKNIRHVANERIYLHSHVEQCTRTMVII
jgi:SNF2 family DNA or RNA helicase